MENEKNEVSNRDNSKDDFDRIEQNIRILADLYVELSQENQNLKNTLNSNLEKLIEYEEAKAQHNVNILSLSSLLTISVVTGIALYITFKAAGFLINKITNAVFR